MKSIPGIVLYDGVSEGHTPANPEVIMILRFSRAMLAGLLFAWVVCLAPVAKSDSLSIVYTSPQNQIDVVSAGFSSVVFTGFVMNNTAEPITFQLTAVLGPPSSFYVASVVQGIGFPGITLAGGQRTSEFDLAVVNINPFDPSLPYPGLVSFSLEAIALPSGDLITTSADSVTVVKGVPEPATASLLVLGLLAGGFALRNKL